MLRSLFQRGPELKSAREIGLMREAGKLVAEALRMARAMCRPGVRTPGLEGERASTGCISGSVSSAWGRSLERPS